MKPKRFQEPFQDQEPFQRFQTTVGVVCINRGPERILCVKSRQKGGLAMLFPYSTDAPIYHWPAATGAWSPSTPSYRSRSWRRSKDPGGKRLIQAWCLELGGGVHPVQWVTANFLHAGIMHLVGNMFGLWAFGLIVEGKIGWLRFLIAYLAIGALVMMIAQFVSLGMEPNFGLGASGAVFGLLGMCLVWAPENEFSCLLLISFGPFCSTSRSACWR